MRKFKLGQSQAVKNADNEMCANLLSELVGKESPGGLSDDDVSMQALCVPPHLTDLFTTKADVQSFVVSLAIIT